MSPRRVLLVLVTLTSTPTLAACGGMSATAAKPATPAAMHVSQGDIGKLCARVRSDLESVSNAADIARHWHDDAAISYIASVCSQDSPVLRRAWNICAKRS